MVIDDRREAERDDARDRRAAPRNRTFKGAGIWPHGTPARCIVRNLSKTGACLELGHDDPAPDDFLLVFDSDQSHFRCRVVWRKDSRIGVRFQPAPL